MTTPCIKKLERLNDKQLYIGYHNILIYGAAYSITDRHERHIKISSKLSLQSIFE